ncbi:MAG: MBL fold metallo-hydrolase [Clostridia bacterium]|nr:MBL fold metallo-hydrolase [Clostridia bacterium]
MQNFATKVLSRKVEKGNLSLFFLGQAGFILKTPCGETIAVDPYLSDCCERYFGFKRLMPHILGANELTFDAVVASHAHYDHFDSDSIPTLLASEKTRFIGGPRRR